jgi:hypothetical protein
MVCGEVVAAVAAIGTMEQWQWEAGNTRQADEQL